MERYGYDIAMVWVCSEVRIYKELFNIRKHPSNFSDLDTGTGYISALVYIAPRTNNNIDKILQSMELFRRAKLFY